MSDLLALLLAAVALLIYVRYTQLAVEGWDPLAYLYAAERIANGEAFAFCHPYNTSIGPYFTLAGFNVRGDLTDCLYLNYPPGFPIILAVVMKASSADMAFYVPALFGAVGLLVTYALGRMFLHPFSSLVAMIVVAVAPVYLEFATSLWSDLPVAVLLLAGLLFLILADRQKGVVWQIAFASFGAFMIGWAVFSRYSAGIYLVPLLIYYLLRHPLSETLRQPVFWSSVTCIGIVLLGLAVFNKAVYGGFLQTPYSSEHGWYEWSMFSTHYMLGNTPVGESSLIAFVSTLWKNFGWLLLLAVVGGFYATRLARIAILPFIMAFFLFYSCYAFPAEGINARFVLPVLPLIALLIGAGIRPVAELSRSSQMLWLGVALALVCYELLLPLSDTLQRLTDRNRSVAAYIEHTVSSVAVTEPNAVVLAYYANDPIAYHGHRLPLFYRRIQAPPESDASAYFESQLISAIHALFDRDVPVYYIQDADPPFMNTLVILQKNFDVSVVDPAVSLYQVAP